MRPIFRPLSSLIGGISAITRSPREQIVVHFVRRQVTLSNCPKGGRHFRGKLAGVLLIKTSNLSATVQSNFPRFMIETSGKSYEYSQRCVLKPTKLGTQFQFGAGSEGSSSSVRP